MSAVDAIMHPRVRSRLHAVADRLRDHPRRRVVLVVIVPFLLLVGFFVLPLLNMLFISFHVSLPPAPLTLEHYETVFTTPVYRNILWQTAIITVHTTVIALLLGYVLAYSIVRFTRRTSLMLVLVILPFWTNYIVRMYAWINILQSGGVLDTVLMATTLIDDPLAVLYSYDAALIGFVYVYLPLATLTFYASLSDLNPNLIDAAKDLGAGPIKTFFTVTLPMTLDGVTVGVVLVMIPIYGAFVTPTMLGGADLVMIGQIIEQQFNRSFNWPLGATLSVFVTVMVVAALGASAFLGASVSSFGGEVE